MTSASGQTIGDPPIARALFGDVRWAWIWLIVRLYVGWEWLTEGIAKSQTPSWIGDQAGAFLTKWVTAALTKTQGPHPDVQGWYGWFLSAIVLPNAVFWSYAVTFGEIAVGAALILGLFTGIAAFFDVERKLPARGNREHQPHPVCPRDAARAGVEDRRLVGTRSLRAAAHRHAVGTVGAAGRRGAVMTAVAAATMKALVYRTGGKSVEDHAMPVILAPGDAIVKIVLTTICGTDLHILKGDLPSAAPGRILGHEGVGIVDDVGPGVHAFKRGDRVIISCVTSCGACEYCRRLMFSHCTNGGWILGNTIDGTHAEYVRIPYADTSLYPVLDGEDEEPLVMCSDILPTGFECGVLNGQVAPGATVAIVGSGPIGLAALLTAQFYAPAEIIVIDLDDKRLAVAKKFGATQVVNSGTGDPVERVMNLTGGRGVDTAIEAVGIPATFEMCERIIAPGGHIANIGVHGKPVTLHLERLWDRNMTITTRLVDTVTLPMLLRTVRSHKIDPTRLITHHFTFGEIGAAYDAFADAAATGALKVIIAA